MLDLFYKLFVINTLTLNSYGKNFRCQFNYASFFHALEIFLTYPRYFIPHISRRGTGDLKPGMWETRSLPWLPHPVKSKILLPSLGI